MQESACTTALSPPTRWRQRVPRWRPTTSLLSPSVEHLPLSLPVTAEGPSSTCSRFSHGSTSRSAATYSASKAAAWSLTNGSAACFVVRDRAFLSTRRIEVNRAEVRDRAQHPRRWKAFRQGTCGHFPEILLRASESGTADPVVAELRHQRQDLLRVHRAERADGP